MRSLFLCALCLVVKPASASYEFLLVADSGGANAPAIHRYDPVSGAYFGSFGSGFLTNITSLAVDASSGTAYISDANGLSAWDYSTGLLKHQISSAFNSWFGMVLGSDGNLYLPSGSSLFRVSPSNGSYTAYGYGSAQVRWISSDSLGNLYFGNATDQKVYHGSVSNPGGLTAYSGALPAGNITTTYVDSINLTTGSGQILFYTEGDGLGAGRKYSVTGSTLALDSFPSTGLTQVRGFAPAHAGIWTIGLNGTASQARFIWESGGLGPVISLSQVSNPKAAAGVVAPEPSLWIGLGAGLALLAIRRRSRD